MPQPASNWMLINLHFTGESGMLGKELQRLKGLWKGKAGGHETRGAEGTEKRVPGAGGINTVGVSMVGWRIEKSGCCAPNSSSS